MSRPSLEALAARTLIVGFDGAEAPPGVLDLVRRGVGGVILFARNVRSPTQVARLNRSLKAAAPGLLLCCVDQEGGRVARLRAPWTEWPPMRVLGATGDETFARDTGRTLARELKSCGFDLDFAPVLDVDSNPANPVIGDRSFGRAATAVARMGAALVRGLQDGGVAACGKHFPGHGDTSQDSHLVLPRLAHGIERLRQVELPPFRAAIEAGVASVMTAHVVFDELEPGVPATMSEPAIGGLLRGELGYRGLVVSDDLEMKAVAGRFAPREIAEPSLRAGVDAFLVCHTLSLQHELIAAIADAVEAHRIPAARLEEAAARVETVQKAFCIPAEAIDEAAATATAGAPEHLALASRIRTLPVA